VQETLPEYIAKGLADAGITIRVVAGAIVIDFAPWVRSLPQDCGARGVASMLSRITNPYIRAGMREDFEHNVDRLIRECGVERPAAEYFGFAVMQAALVRAGATMSGSDE
jgi:hypothetical protein